MLGYITCVIVYLLFVVYLDFVYCLGTFPYTFCIIRCIDYGEVLTHVHRLYVCTIIFIPYSKIIIAHSTDIVLYVHLSRFCSLCFKLIQMSIFFIDYSCVCVEFKFSLDRVLFVCAPWSLVLFLAWQWRFPYATRSSCGDKIWITQYFTLRV